MKITIIFFLMLLIPKSAYAGNVSSELNDLTMCYLRSMARGERGSLGMYHCVAQASAYCQEIGFGPITETSISPITGKLIIDNNRCADPLAGIYTQTVPIFQAEYDNYERSEAVGARYEPIFFDIRLIETIN